MSAENYFQLAVKKIQTKKYDEAIDALNHSISIKKHWQSYLFLGMALYAKKEYEPAIEKFNESLSEKINWEAYRGLGWALQKTNQHHLAVDAFRQSIAEQKDWKTYKSLGIALNEMNQYESAINAFNNSLAIKKDWESYQEIGRALLKIEQYQLGVNALNQSLALKENARSFKLLGDGLDKIGERNKATNAARNFYRLSEEIGHITIDPLLGEKFGVTASRNLIKYINSALSRNAFTFYPSFCSVIQQEEQFQSWKHLIHIHIPKCAGTNLERPLTRLVQSIREVYQSINSPSGPNNKYFLWHGNLKEKYLLAGYLSEELDANLLDNLQGSFFVNHGAGHEKYFQNICRGGDTARKICLIRDPAERLYSHIVHLGKKSNNKEELRKICTHELFNVMHNYITEHDANEINEAIPHSPSRQLPDINSIEFIDMSDNDMISNVKSSFLSTATLPNIVQYNRLNEGNTIAGINSSLNEHDFKDIYQDLVSKGFLERDKQIDFELLKQRTKERLKFPDLIHTSTNVHPITYIFPMSGNPRLMRTKDFLADPLGAINC